MLTPLATFRRIAPEYSSVSDDDFNDLAEVVAVGVPAVVYGARRSEAVARLVAHELYMQARSADGSGLAGVGAVTSERTGDLAVSYSGLAGLGADAWTAELSQSPHGLAFLRIYNTRAAMGPLCL